MHSAIKYGNWVNRSMLWYAKEKPILAYFEKEFKQFLESSRESVFDLLEFVCSHDRKEE